MPPRSKAATQPRLPQGAGDGLLKASAALGRTALRPEVTDVLDDFKRLTTDEAKARFADHFLTRTAHVMDEIWPTFYELLKRVEDGELYRNPECLGTDRAFDSFREYFECRVGRPFEVWAEMESTYHYAEKYAPDLLKKAFAVARNAREHVTHRAQALAQVIKDGLTINSKDGRPRGGENLNSIKVTEGGAIGGNSAYLMRRIARDRPDILDRACAGEFPSAHAAAIEAGIAPRTQTIRIDDPESVARTLRKHMPREALRRLAELLAAEDL